MSSTLLELSTIIAGAVNSLNKACADSGTTFPGLEVPFSPSSEAFRLNLQAAEAANIIAAAATQLAAMVLPPPSAMFSLISGQFKSAALRICLEASVTEILREGGPQGVHVDEIAKIANVNSEKIARLLRYLATHHVYKELRPDVFTNTRISSMFDTGKSVNEISSNPDKKYDDSDTAGFAALTGFMLDEVTKGCAYLWENITDPATAHSEEPNHTPFNRGLNWDGSMWAFFNQPEQVARQHRFGIAMQGMAALAPADIILRAFEWTSLPADSVVVDVGGGIGTASLVLAKSFPGIKFVVQDRPPVVKDAEPVWENELPGAVDSGRVVLQAHDFFAHQPVKNASVFIVKHIIHNWPDAYASEILMRLREAAQVDTKLVLIDNLISFACHDPSDDNGNGIPGAIPKEAPNPLLANYGIANEMMYNMDLIMLTVCNSQERTVEHVVELLRKSGWRLTKIVRDSSNSLLQPVEAVPIF
ncbi:hypothetical protein D9619_003730 [Psilocybe cf. subviscida]|uniref:O-methyltransferase domain-containing protein n=1 Tax=Psilocybe cf. subviscida TaxID=2480587 RepID=A0A8H5AWX7_9AGAR|nr:hypothetical protein D9619_003730 [Psilocybe cf. subviscida]